MLLSASGANVVLPSDAGFNPIKARPEQNHRLATLCRGTRLPHPPIKAHPDIDVCRQDGVARLGGLEHEGGAEWFASIGTGLATLNMDLLRLVAEQSWESGKAQRELERL